MNIRGNFRPWPGRGLRPAGSPGFRLKVQSKTQMNLIGSKFVTSFNYIQVSTNQNVEFGRISSRDVITKKINITNQTNCLTLYQTFYVPCTKWHLSAGVFKGKDPDRSVVRSVLVSAKRGLRRRPHRRRHRRRLPF